MKNVEKLEKAINEKVTFLEKLKIECGLGRPAEEVLREFKKLQTIIVSEN